MKHIKLTQNKKAVVDNEDFKYLSQWKWYALKTPTTYYAYRRVNEHELEWLGCETISMPRQLLIHKKMLEIGSKLDIDHINHNGLDNRLHNIRNCTRSENILNSLKR